jgi:hypothetical protein
LGEHRPAPHESTLRIRSTAPLRRASSRMERSVSIAESRTGSPQQDLMRPSQAPGASGWEHFPHGADIGVHGWGGDAAESFERISRAGPSNEHPRGRRSRCRLAAITRISNGAPEVTRAMTCDQRLRVDDSSALLRLRRRPSSAAAGDQADARLHNRFDLRISATAATARSIRPQEAE